MYPVILRCVTLSWCVKKDVNQQVAAWEVSGVAPAVCQRVGWEPAVAPGGQATPSLTRKALES